MDLPLTTLLNIAFALIGLLPFIFFRRDGKFNLRWWFTASPFFVAIGFFDYAAFQGRIEMTGTGTGALGSVQLVLPVVLASMSIGMMTLTLGTHRVRLALWHQDNDAPQSIVTIGPYSKVRHPFYTSFLLAMMAVAIAFPHPIEVALLLWTFVALTVTAKREERRLCESPFGNEYSAYMRRTGRFFPPLFGGESSSNDVVAASAADAAAQNAAK